MAPRISSKLFIVLALGVAVIAGVYWSGIAGRAAGRQADKPVQDSVGFAEFVAPPADLSSMMADTDLVALVQIVSGKTEELPLFAPNINTIATVYRGRVLETFKQTVLKPEQEIREDIPIVQVGGTVDRGTHLQRLHVADFPMLELGQRYVVFLRWNDRVKMWMPNQFGPDGTFLLTDNTLRSDGRSAVAKAQSARPASDVLESLRRGGF